MPKKEQTPEQQVVAANLRALMDWAGDHPEEGKPASKKALERAMESRGVVRSTVQRVMAGKVAPRVDTLGALAEAYGLEAWQLLIADLHPSLPPALLDRAAVDALVTSFRTVAKQYDATGPASPGPHRHRARKKARKVRTDGSAQTPQRPAHQHHKPAKAA